MDILKWIKHFLNNSFSQILFVTKDWNQGIVFKFVGVTQVKVPEVFLWNATSGRSLMLLMLGTVSVKSVWQQMDSH